MNKNLISLVLFFLIFIFNIINSFSNTNADSRSVRFEQIMNSRNMGNIFEARTWIKDNKIRIEYIKDKKTIVSIIDKDFVYNYDPKEKKGIITSIKKSNLIGIEIMQSEKELRKFLDYVNAKIENEEKIDNKECYVYKYMDFKKNIIHRIWVWKEYFFPVKVEMEILDNNDTITILYKNIDISLFFSQGLFNVPNDVVMTNN